MTMLSISILGKTGRRKNIKVKPNETILQSLEDVCSKEGLDTNMYDFIFQNKTLDPTLTWRFSNVPNNAKLEIEVRKSQRTETPVKVAVQVEGLKRMQSMFPPSTSLLSIIDHFKNDIAITLKPNMEFGILYLNREFFGEILHSTKLKTLGLTKGSAMLRIVQKCSNDVDKMNSLLLVQSTSKTFTKSISDNISSNKPLKASINESYKNKDLLHKSDVPLNENSRMKDNNNIDLPSTASNALRRSAQQQNPTEVATKKFKTTPPRSPPEVAFSDFKFPEETANMDLNSQIDISMNHEKKILSTACDRKAVFYDETRGIENSFSEEELSDEFYKVTVDDLRIMLSDLRQAQQESDNKPLLTSFSIEMEKIRNMKLHPVIVIRIVFPNRLVLQGLFRPGEEVKVLYKFVMKHMSKPETNFYLYTSPPRVVLKKQDMSLFDYNLSPAAKVYFGTEHKEFNTNMISSDTLKNIKEQSDALKNLDIVFKNTNTSTSSYKSNVQASLQILTEPSNFSEASSSNTTQRGNQNQTIPKWFKMGKK